MITNFQAQLATPFLARTAWVRAKQHPRDGVLCPATLDLLGVEGEAIGRRSFEICLSMASAVLERNVVAHT